MGVDQSLVREKKERDAMQRQIGAMIGAQMGAGLNPGNENVPSIGGAQAAASAGQAPIAA